MSTFSVADAKNTLPRLIDRALGGEEVVITRHGKPVVELRPVTPPKATDVRSSHAWLLARRDARPSVRITSVELLDLMHEGEPD